MDDGAAGAARRFGEQFGAGPDGDEMMVLTSRQEPGGAVTVGLAGRHRWPASYPASAGC